MRYVHCPECRTMVDIDGDAAARYSPDGGVNIYHSPCYIARITRERDAASKALLRVQSNIEAGVFVNATPDDEYPVRILEGHLRPNESTFLTDNLAGLDPTSQLVIEMNKAAAERAQILRTAIAKLRG